MIHQIKQWSSLAFAHVKTIGLKLAVGSEPATRIPATQNAPPSSLTWYERGLDSLKAYCQQPTLVFDAHHFPIIYIGSGLNAATESTYTHLGIDCILNCASALPSFYREHVSFYQHLDMVDDAGGYIDFVRDEKFRTALHQFLHLLFDDAHRRESEKIPPRKLLIHCVFGRSRSVAITTLILFLWNRYMNRHTETMQSIYYRLHRLRPVISLNRVFYDGLNEFEREFEKNKSFRDAWLKIFTPIKCTLSAE